MSEAIYYPIHKGFVPGKNQTGCEKQPAMKFTENYFKNINDLKDSPNVLGILNDGVVMIDTDTAEDTNAFIRILTATNTYVPYVTTDKGMHFYFKDDSITSSQIAVMLCCGIVVDIKLGSRNGLDLIKKCGNFRPNGNFNVPLQPLPFWAKPIKDAQRCNLPTLAGLQEGSRNATLFTMVGRLKRAGQSYEECSATLKLINQNVIAKPLSDYELKLLTREDSFTTAIEVKNMNDPNKTTAVSGVEIAEELSSQLTTQSPPMNKAQLPKSTNADIVSNLEHSIINLPESQLNQLLARIQKALPNKEVSSSSEGKQDEFDPVQYARQLIVTNKLCTIDNAPYVYDHGEYTRIDDMDLERAICKVMPESKIRHRNEIKSRALLDAPIVNADETESNRKYINFNNGLFNIETNTLVEHSPNYFVPNKIPHDVVLEPIDCPELDNFINDISCGNEDIKNQIYEMAGLCLYRRNFVRGCYIMVGPKANGKSTFINFLSYVLGPKNTTAMKLHQLSERFNTQRIENKLANLGDDISDAYISDSSTLKSLITSDTILVDVKNKRPYEITPYATLIFSANTMPRATDATKALLDRIIIVPFKAQFSAEGGNLNTDMATVLHQPHIASEFLRRALLALQRVYTTKQLTKSSESEELKKEYEVENNSVLSFLTDVSGVGEDVDKAINRVPLQSVYCLYSDYCRIAGLSPMSRIQFTRYMRHQLNNAVKKVIRLDDKTHNAFVRIDENEKISLTF